MKKKITVVAMAMTLLAACGGSDSPVGESDAPSEVPAAVPEGSSNLPTGYIGRAGDVASDLENRNAGLEDLAP